MGAARSIGGRAGRAVVIDEPPSAATPGEPLSPQPPASTPAAAKRMAATVTSAPIPGTLLEIRFVMLVSMLSETIPNSRDAYSRAPDGVAARLDPWQGQGSSFSPGRPATSGDGSSARLRLRAGLSA